MLKLSIVMTLNALFAILGGLMLLLAPAQTMARYDLHLNDSGVFLARLFAFTLFGIAIISYHARNVVNPPEHKAILGGFIVAHAGSALVGLWTFFAGGVNTIVWVDIIIHFFFAIAFLINLKKGYTAT